MARQVLTNLDFNGVAKVVNLPDPTAAGDAANKGYVDSALEGLAWKDSCRVATQGNISIASPGATVDGIAMASNDRVLARVQTAQTENGIYVWSGAAVPMTRAADADTFAELEQAVVTVEEGTSAGATFRQTTVNGVIGTNNVVWSSFGTSAPAATETTAGVAEVATQAEVNAGSDNTRFVSPAGLAGWSGRALKAQQTFGDGSATQYTITHNLNSRDVQATVYRNSGAYDEVICDVEYTTVNTVTLRFAASVASNAFRVSIDG